MVFNICDPPGVNGTGWSYNCAGAITDVISWTYEELFCGVGSFELVVPVGAAGADAIVTDRVITCKDGGFIIKNVTINAEEIRASGYDLNGLLKKRLTVAMTDDGRDKQKGYTETIVKHYVTANCTTNATDRARGFYSFAVAPDRHRGISDDAASPRLESVSDVITDILAAQNMGWRVFPVGLDDFYGYPTYKIPDPPASMSGISFVFDVYEATDRTDEQDENTPAIFSFGLGTADNMKIDQSSTDARNTLYCEITDGTVQVYDANGAEKEGYDRDEEYVSLACELSEIEIYAKQEVKNRYKEVQAVTINNIDPERWGRDFHLGDIVTVYDRRIKDGGKIKALITGAKIKRTGNSMEISITIGDVRPKIVDRVYKDLEALFAKEKEPVPLELKKALFDVQDQIPQYAQQIGDYGADLNSALETLAKGFHTDWLYNKSYNYGVKFTHSERDYVNSSGGTEHERGYYLRHGYTFTNPTLNDPQLWIGEGSMEMSCGDTYRLYIAPTAVECYSKRGNIGFRHFHNNPDEEDRLELMFGGSSRTITIRNVNGSLYIDGVSNIYINGNLVQTTTNFEPTAEQTEDGE